MNRSAVSRAPQVELDHLELWVTDLSEASAALTNKFGFDPAVSCETSTGEPAASITSEDIRIVLRQGMLPQNPIAPHVAKHGDSVADVALFCDDVDAVVARAVAHGVRVSSDDGSPRIDVLGDSTILHSLCNRDNVSRPTPYAVRDPSRARRVDHITYCLPFGAMERVARIYTYVFGLECVPVENCDEVGDKLRGMRSVVLRSALGFVVVLTEPTSPDSLGQTQRYLRAHGGAGVQHVALAYDDLVGAVESLRARGVDFLPVPKEYIRSSHQRWRNRALPWEALQRNDVLVDADEHGLLLQLFALPFTRRSCFFFELVQRTGAKGFGANNVRALFEAVDAAIRDPRIMLWGPPEGHPDLEQTSWTEALVKTARTRIPLYDEHLAGADPSDFSSLPSFDKSMAVAYGRFPMSAGGAPGAHRVVATSGTSGDRLFISFDAGEWNRTANWLEMVGRRVGVSPSDVLLNTHCYGLWVGGPALDLLAHRCGAGLVPLGPVAPSVVLQLLRDGVGTAISATPSYLRRLIEAANATGFDLTKTSLRVGFIGAEGAESSFRSKLLAQLPQGFLWIELYGLTETGGPAIAFAPDPAVAELELNTRDFWVEVLDLNADRAVPIGEVGELTITTRRIDGRTPLVRYRTRDLVRATAGAAEAPTRISRLLGRRDDSLKIGGVLVYPSAVAEIMSQFMPPTAEWRAWIVRRESDDRLLVEAEASPDLCQELKLAFQDRVGVNLTVTSVEAGVLARSNDKTQRILTDSTKAATPDPCGLDELTMGGRR